MNKKIKIENENSERKSKLKIKIENQNSCGQTILGAFFELKLNILIVYSEKIQMPLNRILWPLRGISEV
jgi:hypothetical protein